MKYRSVLALSASFSVGSFQNSVVGFQASLPSQPPRIFDVQRTSSWESKHIHHSADATETRRARTSLHAVPSFVSLASSPAGALGVLATIILIHESGHYLAARLFGIEVEEFAVGVGPKLFGFNALGNEFNVRALPLGGYVRFPENYNATEYEELQNEALEAAVARKNALDNPNPALGYRFANFVTFGAVERENRKQEEARKEEELEEYEKKPWWQKLKAIKEKRAEYDALEVEEVEIPYDDNPNLLQNRPWQERAVVISAGVIFNILLSFSIYFGIIVGTTGLPSPVFEPGVRVSSIQNVNTAAATGKLVPGDVIMGANGMPLTSSAQPSMVEAQSAMNDLISQIRATPEGDKIQLEVKREKNDMFETVTIQPTRNPKAGDESSAVGKGPQSIGVMLTPNYVKTEILKTNNPLVAARLALEYTYQLTAQTAKGLGQVLMGLFMNGGNVGASVSGPIGLIRSGSEVVSTKDLTAVLLFAATISINLGVVNAFPLPALDGGQLVFVMAEAITRRKIDQKFQEQVTGFAVFLLLYVTVQAAIGDIFGR